MLQLIEEKKQLLPKDFLTSDYVRIYDFKFNLIKGHWFFTGAYLGARGLASYLAMGERVVRPIAGYAKLCREGSP